MYRARKVFIYNSESDTIGSSTNGHSLPAGAIVSIAGGNMYELLEHTIGSAVISSLTSAQKVLILKSSNTGFMDYNDSATSTTPINLLADTWTTITNDGAGAFTNKTYKPANVTDLMDVTTGAIDPTELSLGDVILIRNDYQVTPSVNNALLEFRYSLGDGLDSYTLSQQVGRLDSGAGTPYRKALAADKIYMGDSNTKDNPIFLQVKLSVAGTLINNGTVITVLK